MDEAIEVFGRPLRLRIEGPDADRRYSAYIDDLQRGRSLTRAPVRGRSAADARDRALEVAHNLLGIERLQERIVTVARELAPGAEIQLTEDARGIAAYLSGPWALAAPLVIDREEVYDPAFDLPAAEELIRAHFTTYLRRAG